MGGGVRSSCKSSSSSRKLVKGNKEHEVSSRRRWPADALQVVEAQLGLLNGAKKNKEEEEQQQHKTSVVIDLEAQPPLPHGWEQFLDLKTGEVYYVDWSSCKRTGRDPRQLQRMADDRIRAMRQLQDSSCSSPCDQQRTSCRLVDEEEDDDGSTSSACNGHHEEAEEEEEAEDVMVAAGCHRCLMYYMLPRHDPACPSCGALLQDVRRS